jgi:hypothetical protein
VVGGACLVVPGWMLGAVGAPDLDDRRVRWVARVLGLRLVTQACLDLAGGRRSRSLDVAVELTHAVSMVTAATIWPAHRRSASVSAAVAAGIAALDLAQSRSDLTRASDVAAGLP